MRLRFLGTGTSSGVPPIGIDPVSDDPRDRRLRTSAALTFTDPAGVERVVLIDAGPDLRQQAIGAGLRRCDAVLLTHHHVDHCWGLDELRRFNAMMRAPIDLYGDGRCIARMREVYAHIFEAYRNQQKSFVATLIPRVVRPLEPFELFGLRVTPLPLLHGKTPVLGYRFDAGQGGLFGDPGFGDQGGDRGGERGGGGGSPGTKNATENRTENGAGRGAVLPMAYCTDVSAIPPETWAHLNGSSPGGRLRVLVLDALRRRKHPTHFTLDEATRAAERVAAERTYFVHMSHEVIHAEAEAELPEAIRLAYDGLELG